MSIVKKQIFGKDHKPTIYYLLGYGGYIKQYKPHIRSLVFGGYRVVAFEYDKSILNSGNPELVVQSLNDIKQLINEDKQDHQVAGIYGVSLGSWLGANLLNLCDIKSGLFNTGAGNLCEVVWNTKHFKQETKTFKNSGHTKESLEKVWGPYEFEPESRKWKGKHALIMCSTHDEVISINMVKHNIKSWQASGDDVKLLLDKRLSHGAVIIRNMFRLHRTLSFFK